MSNNSTSEDKESNSSSAGSSSEEKQSGEGYSADCSGSDLESNTSPDEATGEKPKPRGKRPTQLERIERVKVRPEDFFKDLDVTKVQANGVRINNPMDPRIDLSQIKTTSNHEPSIPCSTTTNATATLPTPEEYQRLFASVKPFFDHMHAQHQAALNNTQEGTTSSEGFTSFFTTTTSGTNETNSSDSKKETDEDNSALAVQAKPKKRKLSDHKRVRIQEGETRVVTESSNQNSSKSEENKDTSTNSSDSDQKNMALDPVIGADTDRKISAKKRKQEEESKQTTKKFKNRLKEVLKPGQAVSMEQALDFSDFARIIVQSSPPFLAVHTNAAFGRMTGIDSHHIVGQPIASILSYPERDSSVTTSSESTNSARRAVAGAANRVVTIQRLVAACGFGRLHCLHVNAVASPIVGRNVTVVNGDSAKSRPSKNQSSKSDGESNDTSLSTFDSGGKRMTCIVSISPIMSTASAIGLKMVEALKEPSKSNMKSNRIDKLTPDPRTIDDMPVVTHFVIYVKSIDESTGSGSLGSLSSNSVSVEARLLGISKEEVIENRRALEDLSPEDFDMQDADDASASTGSREHIATIA